MNQTVDAAVQADEDTEVGDRLDGTGDLVTLVELAGEVFPWVRFALLDTQEIRRRSSSMSRTMTSTSSPT